VTACLAVSLAGYHLILKHHIYFVGEKLKPFVFLKGSQTGTLARKSNSVEEMYSP
jgi:hypothetical protein